MNNKPIIVLFEENELNVSALYSLYAQNIPSKRAFWEKLSNEEIAHATHLGDNKEQSESIIENKFSRSIAHYIMDFVLQEIKRAQQEKVTHADALRTALRIEQSMLEKKCFEIFNPTNKKIKDLFCRLNDDTQRHVQILMKEMKKNKFTINNA